MREEYLKQGLRYASGGNDEHGIAIMLVWESRPGGVAAQKHRPRLTRAASSIPAARQLDLWHCGLVDALDELHVAGHAHDLPPLLLLLLLLGRSARRQGAGASAGEGSGSRRRRRAGGCGGQAGKQERLVSDWMLA